MNHTGKAPLIRNISLVLLVALAFIGNYFKLSLFYGFDFLFGSIFLMVIVSLYGIAWGVPAAILASSCTYLYWHHPYGVIVFTLEILCVGLISRRKIRNLVLADGTFWLFIGMPLNWILYFYIMKAGPYSALFVILKQSVNGIFNTLIASILLDFLPLRNWSGISGDREKISIRQGLFNLILAAILVPALAIMVINSRKAFNDIEQSIAQKLRNTTVGASSVLNTFLNRHMEGVRTLADFAARTGTVPSKALQERIRLVKGYFPDFHNMYVANADAVTVAFYPDRNDKGESTIGLDFSDRQYYKELKSSMMPVMSDVFMGRGGVFKPIVTLSVPILKGGRFEGYALGSVNIASFTGRLERIADIWGVKVIVADEHGKVIASTKDDVRPLEELNLRKRGEVQPFTYDIYKWLPPVSESKSAFERWKNSYYVMESSAGQGIPWKILMAVPVAPYQKQLYENTYINTFFFMLVIIVCAIFLSEYLSRRLVHPIEKLKNVTTDLPSQIARQKNIEWPGSMLMEVHSLVENFKEMTSSLTQKFLEIKATNESLEQRVADRTMDLSNANFDLSAEIGERKKVEEQLSKAQEHLEAKIRQRTADLIVVNEALQDEIRKHKLTEESLASEKEMLSITLLGIGDGVISTDLDGKVVLMNKAAVDLLGVSQREAAGRPLSDIFRTFDEKNAEREIDPLKDSFDDTDSRGTHDDLLLISRDGTEHIISTSFGPIRDRRGRIIGGVLVFRDRTESRKTEEKLRNAQKLESIGVLAGGIAHDFNNLLAAIIGNVSLAKAKRDDSMERLDEIEKASLRAKDLTQQLLTFSKGGAPVRKTARIDELIRQSAIFVTRGSNVRCEFEIAEDLHPVDVDMGQLNQVINNLVINARQAMPGGGVVRISAKNMVADSGLTGMGVYGNIVKLTVGDDGPGIPADKLSRIFDPYFTTKAQGSGLGLATVYSIIKRHDGHIEVESETGNGTSFHIYLPASSGQVEEEESRAEESRGGWGNILVMDDDEFILGVAVDMLDHLGYKATCARDGAEAIEIYRKSMEAGSPFDAVIMDLTVPGGMGGKEAIRNLKEIDPRVTAIVSSGYSNDPILADPGKFGFDGIVTKPYTLDALGGTLHRVVDSVRKTG